jgi:hypothetical protein
MGAARLCERRRRFNCYRLSSRLNLARPYSGGIPRRRNGRATSRNDVPQALCLRIHGMARGSVVLPTSNSARHSERSLEPCSYGVILSEAKNPSDGFRR